jgi:hypothetical protein
MLSAAASTSVRDRTAEFQQIVARLQQQQGLPPTNGRDATTGVFRGVGCCLGSINRFREAWFWQALLSLSVA